MIRLFRLLKPYRVTLAVVIVLAFAQAFANLYLPTLMADIVDTGIVKGDTNYILRVGGVMLLITVAGMLCAIAGSYFGARVATGFGRLIRGRLFQRVEQFSLHEFDTVSTASPITRTTNDTTQVQQVLVIILNMMISAPLMAIGGIILAVNQDAGLSWILVVIIPILLVSILLIMGRAIPLFRVIQSKLDKLNLILDEGLAGVRVIRAFDRNNYELQRFDTANYDLTDVSIRVNRIVAIMMPLMFFILNMSSIAIVWFGAGIRHANSVRPAHALDDVHYATSCRRLSRPHQSGAGHRA